MYALRCSDWGRYPYSRFRLIEVARLPISVNFPRRLLISFQMYIRALTIVD
ncbi:hypothetical protein D3C74_268480 [compost metagenome]